MDRYIVGLGAPEATVAVAGGKGESLSRATRAGFPVPPGFVVTTDAYRSFTEAAGMSQRIVELCRAAPIDDPASLAATSATIRDLFRDAVIPEELRDAIGTAYARLSTDGEFVAVAVRSSATAEDLPEASFAGQQDSFLNVLGCESLLEAVRRCWSSLWTDRAMAYRAHQKIDPTDVSLAVVVQRLVLAETSGILFTVNPMSNARDEIVVNASWGLGEAIVGGLVNPDTIVLDKSSGAIKNFQIGEKSIMTTRLADGTAETAVPAERQREPTLNLTHAADLARLGREVETAFGGPQDIEWAIADNQVYLLQSRPITTLPASASTGVPGDDAWPAREPGPRQPSDLWTRSDMGERWPDPVTPLTWSVFSAVNNRNFEYSLRDLGADRVRSFQWSQRFFGRVYLNEGALGRVYSEDFGLARSMLGDIVTASEHHEGSGDMRLGTLVLRFPLLLKVARSQSKSEKEWITLGPLVDSWVDTFMKRNLTDLSDAALWKEADEVWLPRAQHAMDVHADVSGAAAAAFPMFEGLLKRWLDNPELSRDLIGGLSGVLAADMIPSLWRIARAIEDLGLADLVRDNKPEDALARLKALDSAAPVLILVEGFLRRHGHRCAQEAELRNPRWIEAPEQVVEAIAGYLRPGGATDPTLADERQRVRRDAAIATIGAKLDPVRRAMVNAQINRAQHLVRLRDNGQHYVVKAFLPVRHLYATLGRRWADRGWLDRSDDVFFLLLAEVEALAKNGEAARASVELKRRTADRRQAYDYWFTVAAPAVIDADGRPIAVQRTDGLRGVPASRGRVTGPARLIAHPREAYRLRTGDILVSLATDPGWTPIFPLVAGLVLEIGGQLSHGAIVAREYGLPAVVGVPDATARIKDGQIITVDGTTGEVLLAGDVATAVV